MSAFPQSLEDQSRDRASGRAVVAWAIGEGLPFAILIAEPMRWLVPLWLLPGYPAGWQVLIPLAALAIAWSLRDRVEVVRSELATLFPSCDAPQRHGSVWLLGIGCGILLVAQIGASPPLAMSGAIVAIAGWVNRRHGPFVLKALAPAFAFALLAIPVPYQMLSRAAGASAIITAKLASQVLPITGLAAKAQGSVLLLGLADVPFTVGPGWTGLFTVSAAIAASMCRLLMSWPGVGRALAVLAVALCCGLGVNFALLCIAAHAVHGSSTSPAFLSRPDWTGGFLSVLLALALSRGHLRYRSLQEVGR